MLELFVDTPLDPTRRSSSWRYELFPEFGNEPKQDSSRVGLRPVVYIPVEHLADVAQVVQRAAGDLLSRRW